MKSHIQTLYDLEIHIIQYRKLARDKCLKTHRRIKLSKFQIYNELKSITQEEGP